MNRRKDITYIPVDKKKWDNEKSKIESYTTRFKGIVNQEVKDLKDSIYSFKLQQEPVEMRREAERRRLLKERLLQIKLKRDKAEKERRLRCNFFKKTYSNLMILQEMTWKNSNDNLFSFAKQLDLIERKKEDVFKEQSDASSKTVQRNKSSMFLTTFRHESNEPPLLLLREPGESRSTAKQSHQLLSNQRKTLKRSYSSIHQSKLSLNKSSLCNPPLKKRMRNKCSRNNNSANVSIDRSMKSSVGLEKYKSSIDNIFKRINSCRSKYSNIKSKVSSSLSKAKPRTKDKELPAFIGNTYLLKMINSTRQIEQSTSRLILSINSKRDETQKIKQSIKETIDKGVRLQVNPDKEEFSKMKYSIMAENGQRKVRMNEFEYAIQKKIAAQEFKGLSHLNNFVAYTNRRYIKERLGMNKNRYAKSKE